MKRFKRVYIETTNICNLSCNFCPKTKRNLEFMTDDRFSKIIEQVKGYTDYVYFHIMGEPFLNPELDKFLAICKKEKLKANITTNGTLIKKVKDTLINAEALRQVNISLHSFEANEINTTLEQYIEEIIEFIYEATSKTKIICAIRLWNMDTTELKASNSLNNHILNILGRKLKLDFSLSEKLMESSRVKLGKNIYLNMAEKFEWPDIEKEVVQNIGFCYGLREQLGILVDGTVVPCCLDSEGNIPLGNILENSLECILNSKRALDIYEGFSKRIAVEDLCKRCGYINRFNK